MPSWTHLIRFVAEEDGKVHLGQLVDTTADVGEASLRGEKVAAYLIDGTIFDGRVTEHVMHARQVRLVHPCRPSPSLSGSAHSPFPFPPHPAKAKGKATKPRLTIQSQLLSPVTPDQCTYIRCLGLNYTDHAQEANLPLPAAPILFTKPRTALSDPYPAAINIPKCAQDGTSDYEAELCFVIGKSGRDISEEDALDYVLGYTASNDVSARTLQLLTAQWSFSKGLDGSCPIGESSFTCLVC
jgi:2-keto-4-pentenoate hydratase/2-oxohepta-3-ene-1,7-dioic acid hydratase in catechol pathway